jgi:hypothetical protein
VTRIAVWDARAQRRLAAAAMAVALQGVFYWLIQHEAVGPMVQRRWPPLQATIFQAARPQPQPRRLAPPREASSSPAIGPITLPQTGKPSPHPPIDWRQALEGEVRARDFARPRHTLRFGFPQLPAAASAAPQFGWDYAPTHRVEALPEGGLLINLTDRCAVVLYVLLIPVCKIGHIAANGQLFDRLHDRRDEPDELP